jgi:hypothetical protein
MTFKNLNDTPKDRLICKLHEGQNQKLQGLTLNKAIQKVVGMEISSKDALELQGKKEVLSQYIKI